MVEEEKQTFFNRMTERKKSRLVELITVKQVENFNHEYNLVENNIKMLRDIVKKNKTNLSDLKTDK